MGSPLRAGLMCVRLFLIGGRLVDGTGAAAVEEGLLVVEGRIIAYAGPAAGPWAPRPLAGDAVVSVEGRTLLPGLFNCHTHLGLIYPFADKRAESYAYPYRSLLIYRRSLEAVWCGVTTIRLVGEPGGTDIAVRDAIRKGMLFGPRLLVAGHVLIATGGHGHDGPGHAEADGAAGFRRVTREQIRAGADLIKICLTGGISTAGEGIEDRQMMDDEVAAVLEVAHANGRVVTAHVGGAGPVKDAVRLGVDCLEHGYYFDQEGAEAMARAGTWLVPTLVVTQEDHYMFDHGAPAHVLEKLRPAAQGHLESIRRAVRAGVSIGVGTDMLPSDPLDGTNATVREVELLVEAGMTPLQALSAATLGSATLCRVEGTTGSLTAGKAADVIGVAGRPDERIRDLRNLELVLCDGHVVRSSVPGLPGDGLRMPGVVLEGGSFKRW